MTLKNVTPNGNVGILSYGVYIPRNRIKVEEIARLWGKNPEDIKRGLDVHEKSVPDPDEDTATISVEAARYAIRRAKIDPARIGAIYVGSESHPYAVKPTATIVAEAIGASPRMTAADYEFACKAGTAAIQTCLGLSTSGLIDLGLAIGADVAQSAPGDPLEYAAAAAGAAYILGPGPAIVEIEATHSYTTDTPDFWRREGASYPSHGGRFTGEPAYFKHVTSATRGLLEKTGTKPGDYDYAVFHQPNGKFPARAAQELGFQKPQYEPGITVRRLGNSYSASSLVGLANVLDQAKPGARIMMCSFGSGAGSDAFQLRVTPQIETVRPGAPLVADFSRHVNYLTYAQYAKHLELV
ncbi:MAG: hydroxymethylglutaryl-CoA synthase [Euryarchaeota archaeon]|nr:hydroxymethylglutaryl-CoA synthase [Euryarchaeota archaeon]